MLFIKTRKNLPACIIKQGGAKHVVKDNYSDLVPDASRSGQKAFSGAARPVRPGKRAENGPMSGLTGPFSALFSERNAAFLFRGIEIQE